MLDRKKARKIARALVNGAAKSIAVRAAGYAATTAHARSKSIVDTPEVQEEIKSIRSALTKKYPKIYERTADTVWNAQAALTPENSPDHSVRLRGAELTARILGELDSNSGSGPTVNITQFFAMVQKAEKERGLIEEKI